MIGYLPQDYPLMHAFARLTSARRPGGRTPAAGRIFRTAPRLPDYFKEHEMLAVRGLLDRPVSGLASDSRRAGPGTLFFALKGRRTDGVSHIDEAVSRGAVAVVTERMPALPNGHVTFIRVADARATLARVAQRYYQFPDRNLGLVGVTGTAGKTTVSHLLKHFLNGDQRIGLLGTTHYDLGARTVPSFRTTPEPIDLYGMLAQMRDAGCRQAVLEVSSHGIDQQRVRGLRFDAAVFTNLARDHLDYHRTLADYFEVKSRLFTGQGGSVPGVSVVNLDDPFGEKLVARLAAGVPATRVITFGESPRAQVRAEQVEMTSRGTRFRLVWPGGAMAIASPLVGRYNVSNLLAAIAAGWGLGRDPAVFLARLRAFPGAPGRMERIEAGQNFNVFVDSAHTDDSLRHALAMLRGVTAGRLFVVFGCGGLRDRELRPRMTGAVQAFADFAFGTADNPRTEPIGQIFDDMRGGVTAPGKITWIGDRRRAIGLALEMAKPGDCVLIAGKGHESCQEYADTVFPFDDRQVARELIQLKASQAPA